MSRKKTENTLMTYDQWKDKFKRELKRTVKQKVNMAFQYLMLFLLMVVFPLWMVIDWLMFGY